MCELKDGGAGKSTDDKFDITLHVPALQSLRPLMHCAVDCDVIRRTYVERVRYDVVMQVGLSPNLSSFGTHVEFGMK